MKRDQIESFEEFITAGELPVQIHLHLFVLQRERWKGGDERTRQNRAVVVHNTIQVPVLFCQGVFCVCCPLIQTLKADNYRSLLSSGCC